MIKLNTSRADSSLGIWWWTGTEIIGTKIDTEDALADNYFIQPVTEEDPQQNHYTLWDSIKQTATNQAEVDGKGYKDVERGRVIYNLRTMCFEVTCSPELCHDDKFRRAVVNFYNLQVGSTDFVAEGHYHVYNPDGNPAIEAMYDNM